jgi:putative membrane protein
MRPARREPVVLLVSTLAALLLSGIAPRDRLTWFFEAAPVLLGLPILVATYRRFPLTPLAYRLAFVMAMLLLLGGHYTYSRVPLGLWAQEQFDWKRNDYDRLVHFAGGFVSSILARELIRRKTRLARRGWLFFFVVSGCLAGGAFYEFLEWWAARLTGSAADDFLATQGDPWDTQWDMFLTLLGAISGMLALGRRHERALERLREALE